MGRPKTVYRGKRKYRWVITVILFVLALLIFIGIWLFNYMQKFIVYDKDGLRLALPFGEETEEMPTPETSAPIQSLTVDAEIVVDERDFSEVSLELSEDLEALRACYVPRERISALNLNSYAFSMGANNQNAMLLQLKSADGMLGYHSGVALTDSYGVNGTEDLAETLAGLKERGIYLAAEICTLEDSAMALRNTPLALKDNRGDVLRQGTAAWLDPYHPNTRAYTEALMEEIAALGFDEVVLSGLSHPKSGEIVFSQQMTEAPSVSSSVSTYALHMSEAARALGLKCSAVCSAAALRSGTGGDIGQDAALFFRIFDRIYVETDMNYYQADRSALEAALGGDAISGNIRIVPVVTGYTPDSESWAIK